MKDTEFSEQFEKAVKNFAIALRDEIVRQISKQEIKITLDTSKVIGEAFETANRDNR